MERAKITHMMPTKNNYVLSGIALTLDTKGGVSKEIVVD